MRYIDKNVEEGDCDDPYCPICHPYYEEGDDEEEE